MLLSIRYPLASKQCKKHKLTKEWNFTDTQLHLGLNDAIVLKEHYIIYLKKEINDAKIFQ